ncbi:hypothetical protein HNO92_001014 [Chromobacterium alkanivorans]|nr:hypothetical protein [Chromobacterium alkanivorans]MCS3817536.1 hypothetical protein [Chromobacterium alkanivorans]MCS3872720.1 hypothetical protein [Chromobacterium alkanivorans]
MTQARKGIILAGGSGPLTLRCASLSYYGYCLRRRALDQMRCAVLLALLDRKSCK